MLRCLNNNRAYNLQELFEQKDDRTLKIGRHIDNDIGSDSEEIVNRVVYTAPSTVSRHHAQLKIDAGQLLFIPQRTANGSWCNSQLIPPDTSKVLSPGDIISLGGDPETTPLDDRWTFVVAEGVLEMLSRLTTTTVPRPTAPAMAATQVADDDIIDPIDGNDDSLGVAAVSRTHREETDTGIGRVIATVHPVAPHFADAAAAAAHRGRNRQPNSSEVIDLTGDSDNECRLGNRFGEVERQIRANIQAAQAILDGWGPVDELQGRRLPPPPHVSPSSRASKRLRSSKDKAVANTTQVKVEQQAGPSGAGPSTIHPPGPLAAPAAPAAVTTTQEEVPPPATVAPPLATNNNNNISANVQGHFTCPICQELLVATHSMVPCGHNYCGECLAGWLATKKECPQCRQKGTSAPIKSNAIDNVIDEIATTISDDDKAARVEKKASWESGKARFEAALKAPWGSSGRGGRRRSGDAAPAPGSRRALADERAREALRLFRLGLFPGGAVLAAVSADARRGPRVLDRHDNDDDNGGVDFVDVRPAQQQRAVAVPPTVSAQQTFRVEYCAANPRLTVLGTCGNCNGAFTEGQLKFGQRPRATGVVMSRNAAINPWKWMHLPCVNGGAWTEAATNGVENLRNIAPADQATVRGYLARRR